MSLFVGRTGITFPGGGNRPVPRALREQIRGGEEFGTVDPVGA